MITLHSFSSSTPPPPPAKPSPRHRKLPCSHLLGTATHELTVADALLSRCALPLAHYGSPYRVRSFQCIAARSTSSSCRRCPSQRRRSRVCRAEGPQRQPGYSVGGQQCKPGYNVEGQQCKPGKSVEGQQCKPGYSVEGQQCKPGYTRQVGGGKGKEDFAP